MWLIALILAVVLGSGTAAALDCSGVTFPPTVVICSDPELIRLTDERQQAINEARARIGERAWPVLWEDQRRWVPSYATACGVPPDRPPPDPVPASIKECFRRAGEARIAYLRSYGVAASSTSVATPAEPTASGHIGPSYDCSKATTPLTLLICVDPGLSRLDLRFGQAYWALFQQLDPSDRKSLTEEDLSFIDQVQFDCGLPRAGALTAEVWQARDCVRAGYEKRRETWISRLTGAAREEADRPLNEHVELQRILRQLGFIPPGPVDGVYGRDTGAGIVVWQTSRGRPVTGLLGNSDARALASEGQAGSQAAAQQPQPPEPGPVSGRSASAPPPAPTAEVTTREELRPQAGEPHLAATGTAYSIGSLSLLQPLPNQSRTDYTCVPRPELENTVSCSPNRTAPTGSSNISGLLVDTSSSILYVYEKSSRTDTLDRVEKSMLPETSASLGGVNGKALFHRQRGCFGLGRSEVGGRLARRDRVRPVQSKRRSH